MAGCFQGDRFNATVLFSVFYAVRWLFITPESTNVSFVSGLLLYWPLFYNLHLHLLPLSELCLECHTLTDKSSQIKDSATHVHF